MYNNHRHSSSCRVDSSYYSDYSDYLWDYATPVCKYSYYSNGEEYAMASFMENELKFALIIFGFGALLGVVLFLMLRYYTITVTDRRIYGKLAFGKRVDIPIDFVASVAKIQVLKGITIFS